MTEKQTVNTRSRSEMERWSRILDRTGDRDRLRRYIGSLCLGSGFLEPVDAYFERSGLTEFVAWAKRRCVDEP